MVENDRPHSIGDIETDVPVHVLKPLDLRQALRQVLRQALRQVGGKKTCLN